MIALRPLASLDPTLVQSNLAEVVTRVQEANPQLDLRRGVFAELLAYFHAVLDTQRQQNIDDYLAGRSLKQIAADPTLADPDLVDDVLSNFRLVRQPGAASTGDVTVVVTSDITVTIAQGSIWAARGRRYVAPQVYTAKSEAGQVTAAGDRLLTPLTGGNFAFTISLVAVDDGANFDVRKDTLVVPDAVPPGYVTSYAAADFSGGLTAETNDELMARLQQGIAARALSNRVNMAAALRAVDAFSRVVAMSIIGYGDAELVRAYHSILPVALGGRVDWYVRTQEAALRLVLVKTATMVTKNVDGSSVWQFGVGRSEAPGFYEFDEIRPNDGAPHDSAVGGFAVVSDIRGLDLTGGGFLPDLLNAVEAAYSPYSTAVIQFLDTETDATALAVGATADYTVAAVCLPQIGDIQTLVSSRDVRNYGGDCLVKAPVPCFVQVSLTVNIRAGQDAPDATAIATAIAAAVNQTGFVGALYADQVYDACRPSLLSGQTVSAVDMLGRLRYPGGSIVYLRSGEVLRVADDPGAMVTARTVQFFAAIEDVAVTVTTSIPSDV